MIREKRFREDLYYRLNVLSVKLPPLRDRKADIPLIMEHYLAYYTNRFGIRHVSLTPEAAAFSQQYEWPGNIRELRNVSEQLAVLCEGDVITGPDMAAVLPERHDVPVEIAVPDRVSTRSLREAEKEHIRQVLSKAASRKEAAQILGISKTTLWRRCK